MIRSATVGDAARLTDLWRAAGLRFHPDLVERELASILARDLVLVDEEAGERPGPLPVAGGTSSPTCPPNRTFFTAEEPPPGMSPFAVIREDEGVTMILTRADADRAGLAYDYVAARITLRVNSALTDVGLTALFSRTLAGAGISCNVIAGRAHDHLFVDWDQAARALALLREL